MKRLPLSIFGVDGEKAIEVIKKLNTKSEKFYILSDGEEWYLLLDDVIADIISNVTIDKEHLKNIEERINKLENELSELSRKINDLSNIQLLKAEKEQKESKITTSAIDVVQEQTEKEEDTLTVSFVDKPVGIQAKGFETVETEKRAFYCKKCDEQYEIDVPKNKEIQLVKCPKGHTIYKHKSIKRRYIIAGAISAIAVIITIVLYLRFIGA
jgi:Zn finger protein HypA/HybF involved in hydrogenase expression